MPSRDAALKVYEVALRMRATKLRTRRMAASRSVSTSSSSSARRANGWAQCAGTVERSGGQPWVFRLRLAGRAERDVVVRDHRVHEQEVDEVAEPFVLLARPRREGHAVQLLCDVEAKRQAGQLGWPGDAEGLGQSDGIDPFDVHLPASARAMSTLTLVHGWPLYVTPNSVFTAPLSSRRGSPFRRNEKP